MSGIWPGDTQLVAMLTSYTRRRAGQLAYKAAMIRS